MAWRNSVTDAEWRRSVGGRPTSSGTPHQITSCPWCGSEIREQHLRVYAAPSDIGRCVTYCGDNFGRCEFSERNAPREGLPVMVVDEEIYRRPPSLLIATVDKFAQMPWKGVRPKVVASTATIRRAPDQIQKLFVRKLEVFPPQGTDIRDSFFAIQRPVSLDFPGRRYLGICPFGRRYPVAMIRSYVAHMAAAQVLFDKYDRLADPWMTLTGYFNSMRELAGTRRLVEDDIRTRLRDADQRGLAKRRIRALEELTSRKSGTDIPKILERLDAVFDATLEAQRAQERKDGKPVSSPVPYDVVLATNMIAVGVDIERLGLMLVAGQPKNTSEYIQATSRVGRSEDGPGLVCTVFNWARPRDLSHYERFEHYHETFYKHVEALSVTPFSARALDRGLSGVMVALIRLWEARLNANMSAGTLQDTEPLMPLLFDQLAKRAENATHDAFVGHRVRDMLDRRRDDWLSRVHNQRDYLLGYRSEGGATVGLLEQVSNQGWEMFTCRLRSA